MAQSGVLQASRIQLIRGLVRTMTMPTSPPGLISLPQVSSAVGRLFRWETHTGRPGVVAFRGGFHGRTLLGTTLTGMSAPYKQNFGPFAPEVFHVPFPNPYRGCSTEDSLAALEELFATAIAPDRVAAIILEPVQGDGGFLPAPAPFLRALRELATAHGIVLVLDEIQSGFGRTGTMFAFEHAGIRPDLVTVAKSLAGGLPLSAVVGRASIMDAPLPGGLGGTYGGNALACAAALAVLDAFAEDGLLERGRALGRALQAGLERLAGALPAHRRGARGRLHVRDRDGGRPRHAGAGCRAGAADH